MDEIRYNISSSLGNTRNLGNSNDVMTLDMLEKLVADARRLYVENGCTESEAYIEENDLAIYGRRPETDKEMADRIARTVRRVEDQIEALKRQATALGYKLVKDE